MVDARAADVRRTVRRVRNHWYRAGVPRRVRRSKAEELHTHLVEATHDGRTVRDVVGDDVAAFASEWAAAERSRPLLDLALQVFAAATAVPGALALAYPVLDALAGRESRGVGLDGRDVAVLVAIVPLLAGWQLLRLQRHHLTTQQAALIGVAGVVGYATLLGFVSAWARGSFVALSPITAWSLVVVGGAAQAFASWMKRRAWR